MSILAILEQHGGKWLPAGWETLAAACQMGREMGLPVAAAAAGADVRALAGELARCELQRIYAVEHEMLAQYTPEAYCAAYRQLIALLAPRVVLMPHTYQVRDFGPRLAAALERLLASDVTGHRVDDGELVVVRQLFQGKLNCDVHFVGAPPWIVSIQAGAYRAINGGRGTAPVEIFRPEIDPATILTKPLGRFRDAEGSVDLTAAERIVSVGRGIREKENLPLVEDLAKALRAELAASRPICDHGWLGMERQVGSSGQTVAPKLYVAVGISGAIQHLVGMRGAKTVVAINRDPEAPIFDVASYGVVGDLFEIVPALTEEIRKVR